LALVNNLIGHGGDKDAAGDLRDGLAIPFGGIPELLMQRFSDTKGEEAFAISLCHPHCVTQG
jgi:hypothetical protein